MFFVFLFYGPFKNISLILNRLFIKGGPKAENPGKNHLTIRKLRHLSSAFFKTKYHLERSLYVKLKD